MFVTLLPTGEIHQLGECGKLLHRKFWLQLFAIEYFQWEALSGGGRHPRTEREIQNEWVEVTSRRQVDQSEPIAPGMLF